MQNAGISTYLRDLKDEFLETWEEFAEDEVIDLEEIQTLSLLIERKAALIDKQDDSVRLSLTIMKVGPESRQVKQRIREYQRLHGPIEIGEYSKKRRHHGNGDDAA